MNSAPQGQPLQIPPRVIESTQTIAGPAETVVVWSTPDPTSRQTMKLIESSGTLDFWDDESEDVYSTDDGDEVR